MTLQNSNFATNRSCRLCYREVATADDEYCDECREVAKDWRRADVIATYVRSGFPAHVLPALANDTATTPDRSTVRSKIATLLSGGGDAFGVYLQGVNGCGKTFEACRAGLTVIAAGGSAIFTEAVGFLARITASYNRDADEHTDDILNELAAVPFLVVDDVGAQRDTEHAVGRLFELVNARYVAQRPTIFTSNYTLPKLAVHMAGSKDDLQALRIADRLREMCTAAVITGPSFRATERPREWARVRRVLTDMQAQGNQSRPSGEARKPSLSSWEREAATLLPAWIGDAVKQVDLTIFRDAPKPRKMVV
jgi:DNA replication protein DnaC